MVKVVNREQLIQFLDKLSQEYRIAAPVVNQQTKKERLEYEYVDDFTEIVLDRQPDTSPKKFFLPQNEKMGSGTEEDFELAEKKTILFGVRSCDIEAIRVLDDVYLDNLYHDDYYKKRRENNIIIGLSCPERQSDCFCDVLGLNPVENEGAPLYVFNDGDKYYFKVLDEDYKYLVKDLPDAEGGELDDLISASEASFAEGEFELDLPTPLPEETTFSAPFWENIAEKCLGCGVCTFYCPTCYCFGFFWEEAEDKTEKYRSWDSCMFSLFTKHASGHNPRSSQDQRYRQRIMHKYSYHPENYGGLACTGCGRCISNCPVNLDIRSALKTVENYLQEEGGVNDNE